MLVPEAGATGELVLKVIGPEGQALVAYYPEDTLVEELKNRAIEHFYRGEAGAARYKLVRVCDSSTLHDFLTLAQQQLQPQEELLLVELRVPMAGALDLGAVRAPAPAAVAAATAALPPPRHQPRQPNLQALLSTNELSHELRKILISLVEAGARLAAGGPHYERALAELRAALQPPRPATRPVVEVITPEDIAQRIAEEQEAPRTPPPVGGSDAFRRAEHLQRFLEEFRAWRVSCAPAAGAEALAALRELGWAGAAAERALRATGGAPPAAAAWLLGERGASVCELVDGLPDGAVLQALLKQPQIQRGLLNTRMLVAFIGMVGPANSAALWLASPRGSPLLSQISRTYHSEKYCLAVNQFSEEHNTRPCPGCSGPVAPCAAPAPSRRRTSTLLTAHLVSPDDEICGIFSVIFKPLHQFDLRSVVFGRVVLPSRTFEAMRALGSALSSQPVVEITAATLLPVPRRPTTK
ncbi:uncharacterized protein LOC134676566 [Cydia fagiglandana]|uniref:uncharacterized protein LOC134676566 n=1 Tax=Cydia fagiglandana TaxID=1458189 RepID=UPI002FEE0595